MQADGMSGYAFVDAVLFWIALFAALNQRDPDAPFIALAVASVLFVVVPAYANALYYRLMKKRYARAQANPDHPLSNFKSTSSITGAVFASAFVMFFTFVIFAMFSVQHFSDDYLLRSRAPRGSMPA